MLRELNERINKVKEDIASKEVLNKKVEKYNAQLKVEEDKLLGLEVKLKKEYKDVEKLKKVTFSNLVSTLMKNKDEKLEKEQHEYLMAKIEYDEHTASVELLKQNIENIKSRLKNISNCEVEYKELLNSKIELVRAYGENYDKNKLDNLEYEIDKALRNIKEVEEALSAGKSLVRELDKAKESLNSAHNWGLYDIMGGGIVSSVIKHNRVEEAENSFRNISGLVSRFNKELGDVRVKGITISTTSIAFDIFFDNIFTDWSVQNKINESLNNVVSIIRQVTIIIRDLNKEKTELSDFILLKRNEYNEIIEKI